MNLLTRTALLTLAVGCLQPAFGQIVPGTTTVDLDYHAVDPFVGSSGFAGGTTFSNFGTGIYNFTGSNQLNPATPPDFVGNLRLFCIELSETVPSGVATYTLVLPEFGSSSSAVPLGSNIAPAGIGASRALNLQLLYGNVFGAIGNYATTLTGWSADQKSAFQLAVWELSHDDDYNLASGSGLGFWVTSAPGTSQSIAQGWVNAVGLDRSNNDLSGQVTLLALHNDTLQDQLIPHAAGALIPEPSAVAALLGLGVLGVAGIRRRLRGATA
jgi:hypothetical protein